MAPVAALVAPRTLDAHNAFLRDDSKYSVNGICANKQVVVSHNGVDANKKLKQLISQSLQQQQQHPGQDYLSRTATAAQQVVNGRREEDLNDSLLPGRGGNRVVSSITEQVQDLNGRRKVCWNDSHGNELVEVWEFQPRYKIQNGHHDPCEDAIASMRLYKKMQSEVHEQKYGEGTAEPNKQNIFNSLRQSDLEKMTPQALLAISRPDYYCWCFNARLQSC